MLMRLTPGDDLPTTLGRKVEPVEITFDLGCDEPVRWVEHPAASAEDRKHPSAPPMKPRGSRTYLVPPGRIWGEVIERSTYPSDPQQLFPLLGHFLAIYGEKK
jgi:hypothetical protein